MDAKQKIHDRSLQIAGICSQLQYKRIATSKGLQLITQTAHEITQQLAKIDDHHNQEKKKLRTRTQELSQQNFRLTKQLKETKARLEAAELKLEEAQQDLDRSRNELEAIFTFDDVEPNEDQDDVQQDVEG